MYDDPIKEGSSILETDLLVHVKVADLNQFSLLEYDMGSHLATTFTDIWQNFFTRTKAKSTVHLHIYSTLS